METIEKSIMDSEFKTSKQKDKLLSKSLRAICLTRDQVGCDLLPAVKGWEWFDVGTEISEYIYKDRWAREFKKRVNFDKAKKVHAIFSNGDWVFGIGKDKGCSEVFTGTTGDFQPFSYLDNFEPSDFRIATEKEINDAKK